MINIAICDDDVALTTEVEEMLCSIGQEQNLKIGCDVFFDGSTLLRSISQGVCYDLIYLDVEMRNINGISAAESIRDMGIPTLIVYISNYEKYLKELCNTEPFRFLSKPIDEESFRLAFMAAYKRIKKKTAYFSFTYNKEFKKILLNRIYYFESRNRVVYIHMTENIINECIDSNETEYKFYGKMNDVEKWLSEHNGRFIRIHQSYLVNFDYIKGMNFTIVKMTNGTELQISEDRQKNVRTQFCSMAGMETLDNAWV